MEKEPIFLKPIFKDYIWGGQKLKAIFNKEVENEECTAESWEVSTNSNGETKIKNGKYKDKTLAEIYNDKNIRKEIFGTKCINLEEFPLLIKFIDANDCLSVQVHPDNEYALKNENSQGKTEMWYILDCEEGAQIICGVKEGISIDKLKNSIKENEITKSLNYINVHKGDAIYIPSGTIHALLGKTLVAEVQQNSNVTYRVYDWGRTNKEGKPRELHINKALEVIKTENRPQIQNIKNDITKVNVVTSEFFITNKINVTEEYQEEVSGETFIAFNVIEGKGELVIENKVYKIEKGESFIIPANAGKYKIQGKVQLLQSFI